MVAPNRRHLSDFRGTTRMVFDATVGITEIVEKMHRRRCGAYRVKVLNRGPWDGSMVPPELCARFRARGIGPIPVECGVEHLVTEFGDRAHAVELVNGAPGSNRRARAT